MVFRKALAGLAVALLAAYLYERAPILYMMYSNAPQRITRVDNLGGGTSHHEIKFADRPGFRSCEDALLVESLGVAIVACDPGRERWNTVMGVNAPGPGGRVEGASFYVYDYKTFPDGDDEVALRAVEIAGFPHSEGGDGERDLHTLGMAFDEATSTLLVANHARLGGGGSRIEAFTLSGINSGETAKATHVRTIHHSLIHAPNAIALVEGAGASAFFVTNDHAIPAARNKFLSLLETYLAPPTGTVVYVDLRGDGDGVVEKEGKGEVQAHVVARIPFANGIEVLNATTLAVASTSRAAVYLYEVSPPLTLAAGPDENGRTSRSSYKLTCSSRIQLPFLPDNLSLTRYCDPSSSDAGTAETKTKLLIAGHAHAPSLSRFAATRHACNSEDPANLDVETHAYCERTAQSQGAGKVSEAAPSWVSEWSEEDGLRDLYVDTEYPASATAARDGGRGVGIVAGLYARGLLVWRE